jgi:hypothetical protein
LTSSAVRNRWRCCSGRASSPTAGFSGALRAGYDDYILNAEALDYMRERALAAPVIARLPEHPDRCFVGQKAWNAHLEMLGISALTRAGRSKRCCIILVPPVKRHAQNGLNFIKR